MEKLLKGLQKNTERGWEHVQGGSLEAAHPLPHQSVNLSLLRSQL